MLGIMKCVFDIHIVRALGAEFQELSDVNIVHVSHRLPPGLQRTWVGVYG